MTPQELKASILDLAIRGKLVPQIPEEGTGENLYEQIKMVDAQECSGKRKGKSKNIILPISEDDIPFDVPETWKWVRLGTIGYTNIGLTYSPKDVTDDGTIVLRSSNIQNDSMDYADIVRVKMDIPENKMCHIGDILICARNGSKRLVGKAAIIDKEGMSFGAFMAIFRSPCNEYVLQFINSAYFRNSLLGNTGTTTINQITQDMLKNVLVPLPPLAEQKRIVAKIEELLPLIDRYEQAWSKLEEFNKRFPVDMQKSILQTAIQGKLVEQRPEDGTGEELFQQIQAEKQSLIKAGKIKKEKFLPELTEDDIPFDVPESWTWVRFGEISDIIGTGLVRSNNEQYAQAQYYYFKMNNIGNFDGKCHFDSMNMVNATPEEYERYRIEKGDFLFNTRNSRELVGKTAVVPEINSPIILNNNILKIRFLGGIVPEYMNCFFNSPLGREQLIKFITNTTNVAAIYQKQLITLHVPLPPVAEQKRIVAKLEELLPLCERLK